jgi:hypothetical protein
MFARGYAFMTGFDTAFVLFRWHHVSFPFLFCLFLFQRTSRSYTAHILPGVASLWGIPYHGLSGDTGPPKTDPAERCILSHGQNSFFH